MCDNDFHSKSFLHTLYFYVSKGTLVGLKPLHLLHYLYFAGVIMIGCKRCQDALHYFKSVQDADSACRYLNGVTMEAYKKSILLVSDEEASNEFTYV